MMVKQASNLGVVPTIIGILRLTEVKDYSKRKKEKDNSYEMFKSFDKNTLCTITTEFNITCI